MIVASFKDDDGRTWRIAITEPVANRVKDAHGIDLIDPSKLGDTFVKLAIGSTGLLVSVVYMLVEKQTKKAGVSPEDFGEAMTPDAVEGAYKALQEAIVDFFRLNPTIGEGIRRVWTAAENLTREMSDKQLARLDATLASISTGMRSGSSSTNVPASPGSTPVA